MSLMEHHLDFETASRYNGLLGLLYLNISSNLVTG